MSATQSSFMFAMIDFEASSLSDQSWPVEVGISWIENGKAQGWSSLIRPAPDWSMDHWSDKSAAIHKIPYEDLAVAPTASRVATELVDRIGCRILLSDASAYDQRWLDRLLAQIDLSGFRQIRDFNTITLSLFDDDALDHVYERLEQLRVPHRAGPDSLRLARGWEAGLAARPAPLGADPENPGFP